MGCLEGPGWGDGRWHVFPPFSKSPPKLKTHPLIFEAFGGRGVAGLEPYRPNNIYIASMGRRWSPPIAKTSREGGVNLALRDNRSGKTGTQAPYTSVQVPIMLSCYPGRRLLCDYLSSFRFFFGLTLQLARQAGSQSAAGLCTPFPFGVWISRLWWK